jgi:hydrogenase maturation protease
MMAEPAHQRALLIGVGNEFRTDDGLGVFVARALRRRYGDHLVVIENDGDGTALIDSWEGADTVLVVDAVSSGRNPGTIHRIDASDLPIPRRLFHSSSSHSFGLAEAVELARRFHRLPHRTIVYGVEGTSFDYGTGLSDPVVKSVPSLLQLIEDDLRVFAH